MCRPRSGSSGHSLLGQMTDYNHTHERVILGADGEKGCLTEILLGGLASVLPVGHSVFMRDERFGLERGGP